MKREHLGGVTPEAEAAKDQAVRERVVAKAVPVTLYACSYCGVARGNRPSWCDLGCGSDYNRMVPMLYAPAPQPEGTGE